jgi:hypothetical protein
MSAAHLYALGDEVERNGQLGEILHAGTLYAVVGWYGGGEEEIAQGDPAVWRTGERGDDYAYYVQLGRTESQLVAEADAARAADLDADAFDMVIADARDARERHEAYRAQRVAAALGTAAPVEVAR